MDCREFRHKHVAFVDDVLPAIEMDAMERHREACACCARHDTTIRRSLLIVRNLPSIEPSPDFMARLNERLEKLGPASRVDVVAPRPHVSSLGGFAALAAGVMAVAYMAVETTQYFTPPADPGVAAVAVSIPALELEPPAIANSAFVASVPTGIPVWPAVLMVGQAPLHFASLDFHENDLAR